MFTGGRGQIGSLSGEAGGKGDRAEKKGEAFHTRTVGRVGGDCQAFLVRLPT